jgi:hypothetical protein
MKNSPSSNSINSTNNENYRKISYSESNMYDIFNNKLNEKIFIKNNLDEKLIEYKENSSINNNNILVNNTKNKRKNETIKYYIFKRLIMFMIHLGLISIFEIFFFFFIISDYENTALINLINTYTQNIPTMCNYFNTTERIFFTYVFDNLINKTQIINSASSSYNDRKIENNNLLFLSIYYFLGIFIINSILLVIKFYYKIKLNFKRILLDNLFMIIILGLYEYLFFKTVILQYRSISSDELKLNIVNEFNSCLYQNLTSFC